MVAQVHGICTTDEVIVDNLYRYRLFTMLNIKITSNYNDTSQKNFNRLVTYVSHRAQPVLITDTKFVLSLYHAGAPTLSGPGYVFDFGSDIKNCYENMSEKGTIGPVGNLIDELHMCRLEDSVILTKGSDINTEFFKL